MSALVFTLLRFGFLILIWLFVLGLVLTLRRDISGTTVRERGNKRSSKATPQRPQPSSPAKAPTLRVTAGALAGTSLPLGNSPIIIGRSPDSALVLDDTYSSSRHARIFPSGGAWWVEDLDSTNGTYVHGQRINAPIQLLPGTAVVIGRTTLELGS